MATAQLDSILSSTAPEFLKDLCDNWFRGNPALEAIMGKGIQKSHSGSPHVQTPIVVAGNDNIGTYSAYDMLPTKPTNEFGWVTQPWRQFAAGLSTCGFEVCINSGGQQVFNLVNAKLDVLRMSIQNWLSHMFFTSTGMGNNKKDFYGLPRIFGGITQPDAQGRTAAILPELGGLDPTDPACRFWSAYIDDGGYQAAVNNGETPPPPRPLTMKLLQKTYMCIGKNGMNDKPDCIIMGKDLFIDLLAQMQPSVTQQNNGTFRAGASEFYWLNIRVVWDEQIPPGTVLFINSRYLNWNVLSECYMKMRPWMSPINQDAQYTHILSVANMSTCNRAMNGLLCNVRPLCV